METQAQLLAQVKQKAKSWLTGGYDKETKEQVKNLLENNEAELIESFYKDLEFGTAGLRGIMGAGTNRMNIYTVGMATQGLCNYLNQNFKDRDQITVAIAYDCRNNGPLFAETSAGILSANGIKVLLFDELRPTPELSFSIRHYKCQAGIVITASHNPKEYNGYKVYWEDGGQIIAPHDKNIVEQARAIKNIEDVKFNGPKENIKIIGEECDKIYLEKLNELSLSPQAVKANSNMKIVFTPIHGTGVKLVPDALKNYGFTNIYNVPEQDITDGNFPTVKSPNPENADALAMGLAKAKEVGAELLMATDPDADRVGIAVKNTKGEFVLLNGNQTGGILIYYLVRRWSELNKLKGKEYIVKTIVTTELIESIAQKYNVELYNVLTGFKYIADIIEKNQGQKTFIGGGEESYGYLAGEFVRDKDAVMASILIAEAAAWAKQQGLSLYELLIDIYVEFGFFKESLINIVKKGKSGAEEIQKIMERFRSNPPTEINGQKVVQIKDYLSQKSNDLINNTTKTIELPKANVLQFFLADETKISIRPSGTEPKIKFYFGVKEELNNKKEFDKVNAKADAKIKAIVDSLKL